MRNALLFAVLAGLCAARMEAQHEHHAPPAATPTPAPVPPRPGPGRAPATPATPAAETHEHGAARSPAAGRNLFQSDMTLMTGMAPRDPMAEMARPGWHVMLLGNARLGYNHQGGRSGDDAFESSNWSMIHFGRAIGRGRVSLMMMNSLEAWTYEKRGSPELFQTGESYRGEPLVDRQHPHDLFMNLSATWRAPIGTDSAWWVQLAPVGEPAVGPAAFMHRASSGENPTAPLGHHWQDSTHIAFNVVTAGAGWKWLAIEGSAFHGAEPDEERTDVEGGKIDSAAGRLKLFLPGGWSAQVSHAYLHEPEELSPGNTRRTTASLHFGAEGDRPLAATLLWGRNDELHGVSDSLLLEAAFQLTRSDHVYGRAEWVEKDRRLLEFKEHDAGHAPDVPDVARIGALTVGYLRDFLPGRAFRAGAGADLTAYRFPSGLEAVYGDSPISAHVFLRLRWGETHGAMDHGGTTMAGPSGR